MARSVSGRIDEKRSICVRMQAPGVSVAQYARRYAMSANVLHKWQRDPGFVPGRADDDERGEGNTAIFLPFGIEGLVSSPISPPLAASPPALDAALLAQRVDITLSDGWLILVEGAPALTSVPALVEGLMA